MGRAITSGFPAPARLPSSFPCPWEYLGLEWCAVDGGNNLALCEQNNALVGTFNAATFSSLLAGSPTITAINGTTYNSVDYTGRPTGSSMTTGS